VIVSKLLLELARVKPLLEQKIETFILMFLIIILVKLVEPNVLLEHAREKFLLILCQMLLQIDIFDLKFVFRKF
jgi:hypothetical protein